jgi:beta-phosphoglucomutase-like phosphatase (HAD superfamily)
MATTSIRDLPDPEAVIFDLDGTLVDTVETRIEAWRRTFGKSAFRPPAGARATDRLDGKRLAREVCALAGRPIDGRPRRSHRQALRPRSTRN